MPPNARILIVEDDPMSRDIMARLLTSHGYETASSPDGRACLRDIEKDRPDLVLLDISMPGISGLDVLQWIREQWTGDQLPVLLVTALGDSDDIVSGLEVGANDYIVKPINPPVLLARIRVALNLKRGVERLIEAEQHRLMLASLSEACQQLSEPHTRVLATIRELRANLDENDSNRATAEEVIRWAERVGEIMQRFDRVASYRELPYTEGIGSLIQASMSRAASDSGNDQSL